jgi:PAS domain S-box-containing protein
MRSDAVGNHFFDDNFGLLETIGRFGVWKHDIQGDRSHWSNGVYALTGLEKDAREPSLEFLNQATHPDDRRPRAEFEAAVRAGMPYEREYRVIHPNGRMRWLLNSAEVLFDERGRPSSVIGIIVDITERREAKEALKTHLERFQLLVRTVGPTIWIANPAGQVTDIFGWTEATGLSADSATQDGWKDFVHPDDLERAVSDWGRAVGTGDRYESEFRLRMPGGAYRRVIARALALKDSNGHVLEWIGSCLDRQAGMEGPARAQPSGPLTGAQVRGARGILNWSVKDLADRAGVPASTVRRIEGYDGKVQLPPDGLDKLTRVLSQAGVEFVFPTFGEPGVRPT